nr:hypothetical protein [Micromonospora sp. DSM 115978]
MSDKVRLPPDRRQSVLPDWMRDPPPPRLTVGRRIGMALARLPGAATVRRRWWAWQERRRLYERFPVSFKIVAFFASWLLALGMVLALYLLFARI